MRYKFMRFPEGKEKAVTLSYDDGYPSDIRFSEIISSAGLKCTFNLNSEKMRPVFLTKEQIEEHILSKGHEIAIHGTNHRAQGTLRPVEGIRDILDCRMELEERFGIIIRGMAYADTGITYFTNGANYETIKQYLNDLGIVYARTIWGDNKSFELPQDWYAWMPSAHHSNHEIIDYIDEFLNLDLTKNINPARRSPKLFYMWGHSTEFERQENWEHLEKICGKLAGHRDIWYATNIEIYDYVNAYNSLIYSADGTIIYNPTLYDIWFDVDRVIYKISSGETLKII